ncbi:MAG: aminopeptidase P family protein [Chloroflexi bacterium]|nr:MAG: aminopeptidase P family protein [Chloroflexota bacterium]
MIPHRIEKLGAALAREGLDGLIVTEPASRFYLTGWSMFDAQPGENAFWVLADGHGSTVLAGQGDVTEAREKARGSRIVPLAGWQPSVKATQTASLIREAGYQRVGFDDVHMGAGVYLELRAALGNRVELVPVGELVREIRAIKEPEEIELIREAIRITDAAYMAMREWLKPGTTEKEAAWFLNRYMFDHGADATAFVTILGAGEGAVVPHHEPTDYPIEPGEPCWVDFGAVVGGYCADLTRAFCLGEPDERLQEAYAAVIAALDAGIAQLKAGTVASVAANAAAYEIERLGLPVSHVLGHGIGLQVHELPNVDRGSNIIL